MGSINKIVLVGNLGRDPETRHFDSGIAKTTFSLATSRMSKDGERKTEWHNVIAWGKSAELAEKYLRKGQQAGVEGRVEYRSYDDKEGNKRYVTEIVTERLHFLSNKREDTPSSYEDMPKKGDKVEDVVMDSGVEEVLF